MRNIEFSELKLKDINDEDTFYKFYLKRIQNSKRENKLFHKPSQQYEIFHLNILEGKIILLNKDYIQKEDTMNQELFYDYEIAYKIYNLMLDIQDGIEDEKNERNELYKRERLSKEEEIIELKKQDEKLFIEDLKKYNIIVNSEVYTKYRELQEENKKLKDENEKLKQQISINESNSKMNFFQKIRNRLKYKKLLM